MPRTARATAGTRGSAAACAGRLRVLADPTRLAVVRALLRGPRHVGEINETVRIDPTLLSHHLKVLRDAGLVVARRDGKSVLYGLAPSVAVVPAGRAVDLGCCVLSFGTRR